MIISVEHAYQCIAKQVAFFVNGRSWDSAGAKYQLLGRSVGCSWWRKDGEVVDERGPFPPKEVTQLASWAVRFLADDLLKTTGQRIWGLTFTLHPNGKFNVEYDYNKPAGYEDSDEVITGEEINASLSSMRKQE